MGLGLAIARDVGIALAFALMYGLVELNLLGGPNIRGFFKNDVSIYLPMAKHETVPTLQMAFYVIGVPLLIMAITWFTVDKIHRDDFKANDLEFETVEEHLSGIPLLQWLKNPGHRNLLQNAVNPLASSTSSTASAPSNVTSSGSTVFPESESTLESGMYSPTSLAVIQPAMSSSADHMGYSPSIFPEILSRRNAKFPVSQTPYSQIRPLLDTPAPMRMNMPTLSAPDHWATNNQENSNPKNRKIRFALYQVLIFCYLALACSIITNVIKNMVGRLRPDFMDRCNPDWKNPDIVIDNPDAPYIPASLAYICRGSEKIITEGRKSFPSGHSSSSLFASLFAVIYLGKRCSGRCRRTFGYLFLPCIQLTLMCIAVLIAASRYHDNRHHAGDIIGGAIIGIVCALASLLFPMFTPSWEYDGTVLRENAGISEVCENPEENHAERPKSPSLIQTNMFSSLYEETDGSRMAVAPQTMSLNPEFVSDISGNDENKETSIIPVLSRGNTLNQRT